MLRHIKPAVLIEIPLHLLFWAFVTLMPIITHPTNPNFHVFSPWHLLFVNTLLAIHFYTNAFFLIPVLLNKRRQVWLYFAVLLFMFITLNLIIVHTRPALPLNTRKLLGFPPHPPFWAGFNLLPIAAVTAASFAYRYLADSFRMINTKNDIRNAELVSELAFLRSQISPHFIFNIINSVVALSRINPPAVEPTLIQLSQLLRYMLYITDEEKITMKQKSEYLKSYVELQRMRFGKEVLIDFNVNISDPQKTIEPMLMIPFVENAFKHGIGGIAAPVIKISLNATQTELNFMVSNAVSPLDIEDDGDSGIGLNNVKRRLALLYPQTHQLDINQTEHEYLVNLQLQFK